MYWVDVDYLAAAAAALRARVPLTAALLVETWLEDANGTVSLDDAAAAVAAVDRERAGAGAGAGAAQPTFVATEEGAPTHVKLLLEAQAGTAEPDGIYGLLRSHALPVQLRLYEHEEAWGQALTGHDLTSRAAFGGGGGGGASGSNLRLLETLRKMGCLHVLDVYARSLPPAEAASPEVSEVRFEAAWRAGQWDLPPADAGAGAGAAAAAAAAAAAGDAEGVSSSGFHKGVHAALSSLRLGNAAAAATRLDSIRSALVRLAVVEGAEAEEVARAAVVRLRMLDDVSDAASLWSAFKSGTTPASSLGDRRADAASGNASRAAAQAARSLRAAWRKRIGTLAQRNYRLAEPLLALHGVVLRELGDRESLAAHLAETACLAREAGNAAEGLRSLHQLRVLAASSASSGGVVVADVAPGATDANGERGDEDDPGNWASHPMSSPLARWRLEEAKLLWACDRSQMAIGLGKHLMETIAPGIAGAIAATEGDSAKLSAAMTSGGGGGGGNKSRGKSVDAVSSSSSTALIPMQDPSFYDAMSQVSEWQSATRTESSRAILNDHLGVVISVNAAVGMRRKGGDLPLPASSRGVVPSFASLMRLLRRVHFRLGQFSDGLYTQSEERLKSPEWAQSEKLRARNEEELNALKKEKSEKKQRLSRGSGSLSREEASALEEETKMLHRRIYPLEKQVLLDREEVNFILNERVKWLITALQAYRRCIEAGASGADPEGGDDQKIVFRIIAIWFSICGRADGGANAPTHVGDAAMLVNQVNDEVMKLVQRQSVPSSKFLALAYQICGRLGTAPSEGNEFPTVLRALVDRMTSDHPYHTLYHVHALFRGDQVGGSGTNVTMPREKINAAADVLRAFRKKSNHHANVVKQMDRMIEAYIALARHSVEPGRSGGSQGGGGASGFPIPSACKKRSLSNLHLVPVITASMPIDPTLTYKEGTFPHFVNFGDTCKLVGGINQPKLVEALGSDGRVYKQLAKAGNDDLRQDAVMQQLFGVVNRLLADDGATRARRLRVGTYRVVPFTPAAGVLEWVDNTALLSEYLLGSQSSVGGIKGAHERYRPQDWKSRECRDKLAACHTREDLRATFDKVCTKFKPVMHHFFLENFPTPQLWYEKRLAYTRSVAVNSMVGYVIGLGDRHSSNILIDKETAEMVHIDLGVAFEQGKCLKTPEQVPFRMTRDVVDGMGACGVEGVMRRCCEETLRVLRANKDALTTIVAVLIHDPVLKWTVSPERANQRQRDDDDDEMRGGVGVGGGVNGGGGGGAAAAPAEGNLDAERALMRVSQKLDGYEGSELRSVEGQVQQLLQDAQDLDYLSQMYAGWAAWV